MCTCQSANVALINQNSDTVDAMIAYDVNAVIVATMAMSVTTAFMAWCMTLVAVRQWAEKKQALDKETVDGVD